MANPFLDAKPGRPLPTAGGTNNPFMQAKPIVRTTQPVVQPVQQPQYQAPAPQPVKPLFNFSNTLKDVQTRVSSFLDTLDDPQRRAAADKRGQDLVQNMQKGFVELAREMFTKPLLRTSMTLTGEKEHIPGKEATQIWGEKSVPALAEKFLFGEKPVKDIPTYGQETFSEYSQLFGKGENKELATKWGLPLGAVLTTLDLFPGIPKKKIAETIAKEGGVEAITKILKTNVFKNITDDVAESLARRLAPLKNVDEVEAELNLFTKNGFDITKGLEGGGKVTQEFKVASQKGGSVIEDITKGFKEGQKARKELEKGTTGGIGQQLRSELIDRLSPVYDFVKQAGKNLPAETNPYKKMRLLAGVSGKVEAFLDTNIAPILKKESKRLDDLSSLLVLEREKELIDRGFTRKRTLDEISQGIEELKGKGNFEGLEQSAKEIRQIGSKMLDDLKDSGIISDEAYQAIKKNNEFYVPFEAVEHIADELEAGRFGLGSFNVASQDVVKKVGDYIGDVADPIESLVRKIPKVIALTEKNRAIGSLVDLRKQYPDIYKDLIVPLSGEGNIKGMGVLNVFEDGKNVRYGVPEVVESAVKNLDAETGGILVKVGSIQAKMLRAGATGLNIAFIPTNIIRDVQDALTTELTERGAKAMLRFLASYPRAIFSAAGKGSLYQEWAKAGGLQSTMTEQVFKRTTKTVQELSGKKNLIKIVLSSPKSLVEFANRVGEQSTRLARFKSGVKSGESMEEAAFKSRDISLDFAKAGNKVKVLNQIIPFLNAGIQGSEKLLRLYKTNPRAAIASTGLLFGMPTVALYQHNSQFKDYDDIPTAEKEGNWILLARDRTAEEIKAGEKVIGIKIPKGFLGRMVANTTEAGMEFMKKKDPSTFAQSTLKSAAGISPIGIPYNKEQLGQLASTILPPWIQAGVESVTNTNLYFGSKIVPQSKEKLPPKEQYRKSTPEVYKKVGQVTGLSPLILENIVGTTTGGLGRQIANIASGKVQEATVGEIKKRFSGIRGGKLSDEEADEINKFRQEQDLTRFKLREKAEELSDQLALMSKEEKTAKAKEIYQQDPKLYKELKEIKEEKTLGLTYIERQAKQLGVEDGTRAKYILSKYNQLKTREEKLAYLKDLSKKKVLTTKVYEQVKYLKNKQ